MMEDHGTVKDRRHSLTMGLLLASIACFCSAGFSDGSKESLGASRFFPEIEGWSKDGSPMRYAADNLYEYIDGAADLYITYNFQELFTLNYERGEGQGLTIDIYRHGTPRDGFGIYSQERPTEGNFLPIGTEGYYDRGILNFMLGDYYVKIDGFYLGDQDSTLLTSVAEDIAGRLDGKPAFPQPVGCFPDSGKIAHTERYAAAGFLGHAFLHSAYTAEYQAEGREFGLFIIEADDEDDAAGMLKSYVKLAEDKGEEVAQGNGFYRFKDPYFGSEGKINLRHSGRYIWGLFSDSAPLCEFYLDEIGKALAAKGLIEKKK